MDITGNYFTYDGKSSSDYGDFVIASINTNNSKAEFEENATYTTTSLPYSKEFSIVNIEHKKPLSFNFEILRKQSFSFSEQREIIRWLFDRENYKKLYFETDADLDGIYYNCILTAEKKIEIGGELYGWQVTCNCDSPWAKEDKTITYTTPTTFTLTNDSDYVGYTIPNMKITMGNSGGTITVKNITDSKTMQFNNLMALEQITIDKFGQITTTTQNNRYSVFNKKYIQLISGNNQFTCTGNIASIQFNYEIARRVGI